MGLFNAIMGNASKAELDEGELATLLVPGEQVLGAWRLVRDSFVFTSKRLVLVDRQGVTGRKVSYVSIPYRDISRFSVETAGTFDMESELKIWLRGEPQPLAFQFPRGGAIQEVHRALASGVLG
jgi:hypothetical protein